MPPLPRWCQTGGLPVCVLPGYCLGRCGAEQGAWGYCSHLWADLADSSGITVSEAASLTWISLTTWGQP